MNIEKRAIDEIKNDIKIISTNKLSVSQSKLLLIGALYEIILNREIFPKNIDLKNFVNIDMNRCLSVSKEYKDYLFTSRTLLAARVQKEIYELDYNDIVSLLIFIENKLSDLAPNNSTNLKNLKKIEKDKAIDEWRDYFVNKGK